MTQGIRDERLGKYGFEPLDEAGYKTPAPIENFTAVWVPDKQYVEMHWSESKNAKQYEVYGAQKPADPNENPKFQRLAKTEHLFYHYPDAKAGKTYVFKARGFTHFKQGEFSEIVEVSAA